MNYVPSKLFHKETLFSTPVIILVLFLFINVLIPKLFTNVFEIPEQFYNNYLSFCNAMMLFYVMLPKRITTFN